MGKRFPLVLLFFSVLHLSAISQVSTAMRETKKDSVVSYKYPYIMPILGQKVADKGFQLPYPMGIMINAFYGTQDLSMSGLQVGFNDNPMINLDSIVTFESVSANAFTINARLDSWILPFWDLYVVGGYGSADTKVKISQPFEINTNTSSEGYYVGVGSTVAFGIRRFFGSVDGSYIWNFQDLLEKPAQVLTVGVRTGPVFNFPRHKEMNIVAWAGCLYTNLNSETVGEIPWSNVFPNTQANIDELQGKVDDWYDNLTPPKQILYEDLYNKVTDGLNNVSENVDNSTIKYEMQKKIERPFNLILGGQWQINRRYQVRGEAQFLGDRFGGLISFNYRFGLRGKNFLSGDDTKQ